MLTKDIEEEAKQFIPTSWAAKAFETTTPFTFQPSISSSSLDAPGEDWDPHRRENGRDGSPWNWRERTEEKSKDDLTDRKSSDEFEDDDPDEEDED
jgi:hypothetical protein